MKTSQLLQAAACVEILSQELYTELSATFSDSPTLRDLFLRLAEEEAQHAKCLQLLDRHRVKAPLTAEVSERIRGELAGLADALERVRTELRSPALRTDPYAALGRMAELEARFASVHAAEIATEAYPAMKKVFAAMERQDRDHARLISWARTRMAA
jgi:rubrerythrin